MQLRLLIDYVKPKSSPTVPTYSSPQSDPIDPTDRSPSFPPYDPAATASQTYGKPSSPQPQASTSVSKAPVSALPDY